MGMEKMKWQLLIWCVYPYLLEHTSLLAKQSFYGLPSAGAEGSKTNVDPEHALLSVRPIHSISCHFDSYA